MEIVLQDYSSHQERGQQPYRFHHMQKNLNTEQQIQLYLSLQRKAYHFNILIYQSYNIFNTHKPFD